MAYELKLAQWSGPLEKLLELIEERKLEITEVSLSQVTDDFLKYLGTVRAAEQAAGPEDRASLRVLADFILVASRLIFIKSKSLLPDLTLTPEEEAGIKDLEERLKLYRELRPAMRHLARLWREGNTQFSRPYFLNLAHWIIPHPPQGGSYVPRAEEDAAVRFFYPGRSTSAAVLQSSLTHIFEGLQVYTRETEVVRENIISLEEKIDQVIRRVEDLRSTSLREIAGRQPRGELIVTFLALLHLAREQLVFLEQAGRFSDIIITKK